MSLRMVQIFEKCFKTSLHCSSVLCFTERGVGQSERSLCQMSPHVEKHIKPLYFTCTQQIVVLDVQAMGCFAPGGLGGANLCQQHSEVVKTSASVALPRGHASQ